MKLVVQVKVMQHAMTDVTVDEPSQWVVHARGIDYPVSTDLKSVINAVAFKPNLKPFHFPKVIT